MFLWRLLEGVEESWLILEELSAGFLNTRGLFEDIDVGSFVEVAGISGFAARSFAGVLVGGVGEERFLLEEAEEAVVVVAAHHLLIYYAPIKLLHE